jgi:hypothetical protein
LNTPSRGGFSFNAPPFSNCQTSDQPKQTPARPALDRSVKQNQPAGRGITLIAPPSAPPPPDGEEQEKPPVPQEQPMSIQLTTEETRRGELGNGADVWSKL